MNLKVTEKLELSADDGLAAGAPTVSDTPLVDAALADAEDFVACDTRGQGVHASVARKLEREINHLRSEFQGLLPLLEAAAQNKPVSIAAGEWVLRVNALLCA